MTTPTIDTVIERLDRLGCKPKASGEGQWWSRCPVHKGNTSNLSIRVASDGTVLLRCHHRSPEACTTWRIAEALGLTLRDLFPVPSSEPTLPGTEVQP